MFFYIRNQGKPSKPACALPQYKGDGNCDDENNNKGCEYDGGDCCVKSLGGVVKKNYCKVVGFNWGWIFVFLLFHFNICNILRKNKMHTLLLETPRGPTHNLVFVTVVSFPAHSLFLIFSPSLLFPHPHLNFLCFTFISMSVASRPIAKLEGEGNCDVNGFVMQQVGMGSLPATYLK